MMQDWIYDRETETFMLYDEYVQLVERRKRIAVAKAISKEVERMPTCCGVESKVNQVYKHGNVDYICPVCGKVYAIAEMGNVFNMPPKWKVKIEEDEE